MKQTKKYMCTSGTVGLLLNLHRFWMQQIQAHKFPIKLLLVSSTLYCFILTPRAQFGLPEDKIRVYYITQILRMILIKSKLRLCKARWPALLGSDPPPNASRASVKSASTQGLKQCLRWQQGKIHLMSLFSCITNAPPVLRL